MDRLKLPNPTVSISAKYVMRIPTWSFKKWVGVLIQLGMGALFVYAGLGKIMDPFRFSASLLGYQIIPMGLIDWITPLFPWVEITLGLAMILGLARRLVGLGMVLCMVVFTLLIGYAYYHNLVIDCGCFGAPRPVDGQKIIENLLMLVASMAWWRGWVPSVSVLTKFR